MNPQAFIAMVAKTAAVQAATKYAKENGRRVVHVVSNTNVQAAAVDLGRAVRVAWSEAGPSAPQPAMPL
jgi:molybdopterin-guanine dinucleotide biosynthesis protein A